MTGYIGNVRKMKTSRKTLDALKRAVAEVKAMSPEELEAMMQAQRKSWARQDMD